jgi:putative ABC transport system substrate-binding protein
MRRRQFIIGLAGAAAWPLEARAGPIKNKYRIAFVTAGVDPRSYYPAQEFLKELSRLGYVEGQNIVLELFSTHGNSERRAEVAHEVVRGNPDAIFVITGPLTQQVKEATATIPISCITAAAETIGVDLIGVAVASPMQEAEYRTAFEAIAMKKIEALVLQDSTENVVYRELMVELVEKAKIPAIYPYRPYAEVGGLITYAVDEFELYRIAADQIDQMIKGKSVQEIPWYQARSFQLILNIKAASAIGIEFPPTLVGRADEVIE